MQFRLIAVPVLLVLQAAALLVPPVTQMLSGLFFKIGQQGRELAAVRRQLLDAQQENNNLQLKLSSLISFSKGTTSELNVKDCELDKANKQVEELKTKNEILQNEKEMLKTCVQAYKKGTPKQKLKRLEHRLQNRQQQIDEAVTRIRFLENQCDDFRRKLRKLQT